MQDICITTQIDLSTTAGELWKMMWTKIILAPGEFGFKDYSYDYPLDVKDVHLMRPPREIIADATRLPLRESCFDSQGKRRKVTPDFMLVIAEEKYHDILEWIAIKKVKTSWLVLVVPISDCCFCRLRPQLQLRKLSNRRKELVQKVPVAAKGRRQAMTL